MNFLELIQYILTLFLHRYNTGVVDDERDSIEKEKDYLHEETAGTPPPQDPFSNKILTESSYPIENQYRTSACVAYATCLAKSATRQQSTDKFQRLSPLFVYRHRRNFPGEGSSMPDIFGIMKKYGAPLFETVPTPFGASEVKANTVDITSLDYTEAEIFGDDGDEYYTFGNPKDFEEIARVAQSGFAVAVLIYATYDEWAHDVVEIKTSTLPKRTAPIRHAVVVLPKSGHWRNGKRYLTIQDSSHFGRKYLRHVPEDFMKARCYYAMYWKGVSFIGSGERPDYTFTKVLRFGMRGNEVIMAQKLLIAEGLLPSDCATGYYGGRTLSAVRAFQSKYADDILTPIGLSEPTNTWGSQCIAKANKLCHRDERS